MSKAVLLGAAMTLALFGCGRAAPVTAASVGAARPSGPVHAEAGPGRASEGGELPSFHAGCGGEKAQTVAEAYAAYKTTFGPSCTVATTRGALPLVAVTAGGRTFPLAVKDVPLRVTPSESKDGLTEVEVLAPVHFKGRAKIDAYLLAEPFDGASGMLHAERGTMLTGARVSGDRLVGRLEYGYEEALAEDVDVPCSALTVAISKWKRPQWVPIEKPWVVDAVDADYHVTLMALPGSGPTLRVSVNEFRKVGEQGGWTQLYAGLTDGSFVRGWVSSSKIHREEEGGGTFRGEGIALCGVGTIGRGYDADTEVGEAFVAAGTKVAVSPGGAEWGEVPSVTRVIAVHKRGSDVAEIMMIRGIGELIWDGELQGEVEPAFVPANAVRFTGKAWP